MTAPERDVERTALDVRVEAEDRAGVMPAPVEGADVIAAREVCRRIEDHGTVDPGLLAFDDLARTYALAVLVEAFDRAGDQWDPHAYVGSVASGVVRALRDLGAVPQ